ncbi:MAG: alpha/beta hydrolase [Opitutaceae bacterium]|nr:alpha/beta hydrolase [Opitutaceae bacterium]
MKNALLLLLTTTVASAAPAITVVRDVRYAESGHPRHVLDIHAPAGAKDLPVVFWIHGGGWQAGDKGDVKLKPQMFTERGFVFVSTNYRLLPHVPMGDIIRDIAQAFAWTHAHIARHGGDPRRILVGGHSAGAQLAALLCTDAKYLRAHGLSFASIKGCIPVDGDTYDVPAIIEVAETRARAHGLPLPKAGHRQKFGDDPALHRDFSAVTHVAKDRGIPPFLILFVVGHPDTTAQAQRFNAVLKAAAVPARLFGARDTDHVRLNDNLGTPGDPATAALWEFVELKVR